MHSCCTRSALHTLCFFTSVGVAAWGVYSVVLTGPGIHLSVHTGVVLLLLVLLAMVVVGMLLLTLVLLLLQLLARRTRRS